MYDLHRQAFPLSSDLNISLYSLDNVYDDWYLSQEGLYESHFKKSSQESSM